MTTNIDITWGTLWFWIRQHFHVQSVAPPEYMMDIGKANTSALFRFISCRDEVGMGIGHGPNGFGLYVWGVPYILNDDMLFCAAGEKK